MSNKIKEKITEYLHAATNPAATAVVIKNPDRKSNAGPALFDIYYWQEVSSLADKELKQAWAALADEGLIKPDDSLRALGVGEHIAVESNHFSVLAKVASPSKRVDKKTFLEAVARKARISVESLEEIWDNSCKEAKSPLTKRVIEV